MIQYFHTDACGQSDLPFDAPEVEADVPQRFARVAGHYGDRLAVCTGEHRWTYAELHAISSRLAHAILARQPEATEPVALLMDHGAILIAAILAVLKAGRPYVVLDPALRADGSGRISGILAVSGASLVLHDAANRDPAGYLAPDSAARLEASTGTDPVEDSRLPAWPEASIAAHAPAVITFTSGTTSKHKGVSQSHRFLLHHCRNYSELAGLRPDDRICLLASCSLSASMSSLWGALLNGAALFPYPLGRFGVHALPEWVKQNQITVLHCVPTVFRACVPVLESEGPRRPLGSLRLLRLGGETIVPHDVDCFKRHAPAGCGLMLSLSSTETGAIAARVMNHENVAERAPVPLGCVLPGIAVELRDEAGMPAAPGKVGRIFVQSDYLASGYWRDAELTARGFQSDPRGGGRVFDTGDLGRIREDGLLEHHGRSDSQIKIRGLRADPAQIESALLSTPRVEQAVVLGATDTAGVATLTAYIAGPLRQLPTDRQLRAALRRTLLDHLIPASFIRLAELPRMPGGKIDRSALRQLPISNVQSPDGITGADALRAPPRDELEIQIAAVLKKILGKGPMNRDDDFFDDLGGTSLQAANLIAALEQKLGLRLQLSALVENPTVETLANLVSRQIIHPTHSPLVLLKRGTTVPLFLMHRGHGGLYGYRQLAAALDPDQSVYGLQCIGLQGEAWPLMSLPAIARRYKQEILSVQPDGPYFLGGACMGGLLAMEVAQQLLAENRRVGLLALFNSTHPQVGTRRSDRRRKATDRVNHAFRVLRWRTLWMLDRATGQRMHLTGGPGYRRFIAHVLSRARRAYQPQPYPGSVEIFIGEEPADPQQIQRRLALGDVAQGGAHVHRVPGSTIDVLMPPGLHAVAPILQSLIRVPGAGDKDARTF